MSLAGAMNSGISGLQSFSTSMGVIGNNLANTNTAGFKASRTLFSDLIPDTISGSGGVSQVGRGSNLSTVDDIFTQGSIESTSSNLDLAIEGTGFFIVRNPDSEASNYTRAGTFRLDQEGYLINPEGYIVQGYERLPGDLFADLTSDIKINTRSSVPGEASSRVELTTNLDANTRIRTDPLDINNAVGTSNFATTSEIYDTLGNTHLVTNYFRKTGTNEWTFHQTIPATDLDPNAPEGSIVQVGAGVLRFDNMGLLESITLGALGTGPTETTLAVEPYGSYAEYTVAFSTEDADYEAGGTMEIVIDGETITAVMADTAEESINALIAAINTATEAASGHALEGVLDEIVAADHLDGGVLTLTSADPGEGFVVSGAGSVIEQAAVPLVVGGDPGDTEYTVTFSPDDADYEAGGTMEIVVNGETVTAVMADTYEESVNALIAAINTATEAGSGHALEGMLNDIEPGHLVGGVLTLTATDAAHTVDSASRTPAPIETTYAVAPQGEMVGDSAGYTVAFSADDADYAEGGSLQVVINGQTIEAPMADTYQGSVDALIAAINDAVADPGHALNGLLNVIEPGDLLNGVLTLSAVNPADEFELTSAVAVFPGEEGDLGETYTTEHPDWPRVTTIDSGMLGWHNGSAMDKSLDYVMSITQFATDSRVVTQQSDGFSSGYLTDVTVDVEGIITGSYSNGISRSLGRLALGKFANDNGLEKLGNNLYASTRASGPADIGTPGSGFGRVFSNSLEQSTVDIAAEFTRMITTQRSFQANSKTITTADEMLAEVINMKR